MDEFLRGAMDIIRVNRELKRQGVSNNEIMEYWKSIGQMANIENANQGVSAEKFEGLENKVNCLIDIIDELNDKVIKLEKKT